MHTHTLLWTQMCTHTHIICYYVCIDTDAHTHTHHLRTMFVLFRCVYRHRCTRTHFCGCRFARTHTRIICYYTMFVCTQMHAPSHMRVPCSFSLVVYIDADAHAHTCVDADSHAHTHLCTVSFLFLLNLVFPPLFSLSLHLSRAYIYTHVIHQMPKAQYEVATVSRID